MKSDDRIVMFSVGSVLIFVTRKANCVELQTNLKARDLKGRHSVILCDTILCMCKYMYLCTNENV